MNVTVLSRSEAIKYCWKKHDGPTIMISISNPYAEYSSVPLQSPQNGIKAILRLRFEDAEGPSEEPGSIIRESDLITEHDAKLIKTLLGMHPDTDIIVHCDAGVSRSAGIAAAILKHRTGDDSRIFGNPRYNPNMLCYRTVLDALQVN